MSYDDVVSSLRTIYDARAAKRDATARQSWKLEERGAFLDRLQAVEATTLLDLGAGTGQDAAHFAAQGLKVIAVDIAPEHVALCRDKGLTAEVRDVLHLGFAPAAFDAVWSLNCLLHVPDKSLPAAFRAIREVLKPGGLFFVGLWGGADSEGIMEEDGRFFAFRSDERLLRYASEAFDLVDFHTIDHGFHFQTLTLARPLP
ncbi:class I SAM-dependent methyltransferase [Couchioplanes caeruleus]|uniref:class I SAM-dependent methyltransferase n=1 Tax=Couchioplanes caeruleus TaxID=56438 RepID=UPI0020C1821E|nr:class I SAM-dependent methyltransferase [Couchioplanes caeruleus]UQU64199.1 class I SAM-dependent methyltransferase [Couchioplanes caeruleus]